MTTLSEKNEDLEAGGGSPSPLKIRMRRKPNSKASSHEFSDDQFLDYDETN